MISISTSALKRSKWWEYVLRFVLGGLVTAIAGLLAKKISPSFGGLFLAFPAILAASATLVEKHERQRKQEKGMHGMYRGRHAAGADAAGAAMGSFGLIAFAVFVWKLLPAHNPGMVIICATLLWMLVCGFVWFMWKKNLLRRVRVATASREELSGKRGN
jgi:phosphotransferase system  glucose/maltose/N-acetylglucosamine-specific IIC component